LGLLEGIIAAATAGFGNPILATLELIGSVVIAALTLLAPFIALVIVVGVVFVVARRVNARRLVSVRGVAEFNPH
jgi:hypothetical protein